MKKKIFLEVNILLKLKLLNIMYIYEFYEDNANYYIISKFCKGMNYLYDNKGAFYESEATLLMHQLILVIFY